MDDLGWQPLPVEVAEWMGMSDERLESVSPPVGGTRTGDSVEPL